MSNLVDPQLFVIFGCQLSLNHLHLVLTVALHKFVSALLRQNPHYPLSSPPGVIIGFQSTRPLMVLSSNLTVHKQIFVAAQRAASEALPCSAIRKFYQT